MSNFMKVRKTYKKNPPLLTGSLAFSLAFGLMAFAPSPVLANADANTHTRVRIHIG